MGMEDVRGQVSESSGGRAGDEGMEVIERSKVGTQNGGRYQSIAERTERGGLLISARGGWRTSSVHLQVVLVEPHRQMGDDARTSPSWKRSCCGGVAGSTRPSLLLTSIVSKSSHSTHDRCLVPGA
jgi:hypothetical protein